MGPRSSNFGHTHEQFVDLFHAIGSDPDNCVVILTGSGDAVHGEVTLDGFDFFTPQGRTSATSTLRRNSIPSLLRH